MSDMPVWHLFAYTDDDPDGTHDERRTLSQWQLHDVLRWCVYRGYDHIYFSRSAEETVRFEKKPPPDQIRHHC